MKKIFIIGSGFSSISASTYLAKKGYKVTVFEKNSSIGGRARQFIRDGFTFDIGPSWYWMPDVFESYFNDFGKQVSDYYKIDKLNPAYEVYFNKLDSVFIDWWDDPEDKEYGGFHFAPMAQYVQRNPFSPPRTTFEAIKLDGTFRLLPDIVGRRMTDAYDGQDINYLIENTGKNGIEHRYVNQFIDRVASKWVYDLPPFDLNDNRFWIKNRKYIQSDKFIRYNLFKRVEMWELEVKVQVDYYKEFLEGSYRMLDSVIAAREREYKIIYWVLNPQT